MSARRLSLLLVLLAVAAAPAMATIFCKSPSGAVFLRDACKRKETEVDLAASAAAPKGDPGPAGRSQPRLRAVDGGGQELPGSFEVSGQFVYRLGSRSFALELHPDRSAGGFFYYDAMLCAGPRLISAFDGDLYETATVLGTTAYYAGDPIGTHTARSYDFASTAGECATAGGTFDAVGARCCMPLNASYRAGVATPVDLSGFSPPFRLEVEE